MPPRKKTSHIGTLSPKIPEGQPPLIGAEYAPSGLTDPEAPPLRAVVGAVYSEDGPIPKDVLPQEPSKPDIPSLITSEVLAADAVLRHRRAQAGSHSAIDPETGLYKPWAGAVMEGFGVVTTTNMPGALEWAKESNRQILAERAARHPRGERPIDALVSEVADKLSMDSALNITVPNVVPDPETLPEPHQRADMTRKPMAIARLLASIVIPKDDLLRGEMVSEAAIRAAEPSNLFKHLVGYDVIVTDRKTGIGKQAAMYKKPNGKWQAVALSAQERRIFKSHIEAYADAPDIATRASATYNPESDPGAPARATYHALDESTLPKMETYVETLQDREEILKKFEEALAPGHYGLARMGNEATMRGNASILFDQILPDALNAIGEQKQWTPRQAKLAYATIMHRVTATNSRGKRDFAYTQKLVKILKTHNKEKMGLFMSSIEAGIAYSELHHRIAAAHKTENRVQ